MPRGLKIIIFTSICSLMVLSFVAKWLETYNVYLALQFMLQVILILIGMVSTGAFFIWLGTKIFRD